LGLRLKSIIDQRGVIDDSPELIEQCKAKGPQGLDAPSASIQAADSSLK
jgi:hypothetical protein